MKYSLSTLVKIHTYGIDTSKFTHKNIEKTIDVLSIGAITGYKRHEKIINLPGKNKLVIGDITLHDSKEIIERLEANNVEVKSYASQDEIAKLINQSRLIYIPSETNGGGERALMEAKSCKATIKIEDDNPKLKETFIFSIMDRKVLR